MGHGAKRVLGQSLLDRYLPDWRSRQVDRIFVAASPREAWGAVRGLDFYRFGFIRFLFGLRDLPNRLLGRGTPLPRRMTIDDIFNQAEPGFRLLEERPGREIALGAIGQVWKSQIPFLTVASKDWAAFSRPHYCKVAWSLGVEPGPRGGSTLRVDLRVGATTEEAWNRFKIYWTLIGPFSHAIRKILLASFKKELFPMKEPSDEVVELMGDDIIPQPQAQLTMSRLIESPPGKVWPWLVQMGCRRGGWYSYDRLDNGGRPSAVKILPEFQKIKVGDQLPATPTDKGGFAVLELRREKGLVLGPPELLPKSRGKKGWGLPYLSTWQFDLEPVGQDACRLLVRVRGNFQKTLRMALFKPVILLIHRFMENRQLTRLKQRCESPGAI